MPCKVEYIADFPTEVVEGYVIHISEVHSKAELMDEVDKQVDFPGFGKNWDALYDVYTTLEWIPKRRIYICHDGLSELPLKDLETYLEVVLSSVRWWEDWPADTHTHDILFCFPLKEKGMIVRMLEEMEVFVRIDGEVQSYLHFIGNGHPARQIDLHPNQGVSSSSDASSWQGLLRYGDNLSAVEKHPAARRVSREEFNRVWKEHESMKGLGQNPSPTFHKGIKDWISKQVSRLYN